MVHSLSDKTSSRSLALARRRELTSLRDLDADAELLASHLLALDVDRLATVAAYESFGREPSLRACISALTGRGDRVILPITLSDNDLDWYAAGDPNRTPLGVAAISGAGLILVPGLTTDRAGHRLGRGGGSYDRALARRAPGSLVLIVLHPGEISDQPVPHEPHDQPVDGAVSAAGIERFSP